MTIPFLNYQLLSGNVLGKMYWVSWMERESHIIYLQVLFGILYMTQYSLQAFSNYLPICLI